MGLQRASNYLLPILPIVSLALAMMLTYALLANVVDLRCECGPNCGRHCAAVMPIVGAEEFVVGAEEPDVGTEDPGVGTRGQIVGSDSTEAGFAQPFADLKGRLTWVLFSVFFGMSALAAVAVAIAAISGMMQHVGWSQLQRLVSIVVLISLALVVGASILNSGKNDFLFSDPLIGKPIYEPIPYVEKFIDVAEILAMVGMAILAIAVSSILFAAGFRETDSPAEKRAGTLAKHLRHVQLLLYVSAVPLVAGTLQTFALYEWGGSLVVAGPIPVSAGPSLMYFTDPGAIPTAMGMMTGALYSVLLAAVFTPTFALLRKRAIHLVEEALPDALHSEQQEWLRIHSLETSVPRKVWAGLAVLAPPLAGAIVPRLLEIIGKGG